MDVRAKKLLKNTAISTMSEIVEYFLSSVEMSLNGNLISEIRTTILATRPSPKPKKQTIRHQRGNSELNIITFIFCM